MKLHIGCGKRNFGPKWTHIDQAHFPHIDFYDLTSLNIDDSSIDLIYSSHTIEYFDRDEIIPILKEWSRVLKPSGILRLAVPDFEAMTKLYCNNSITLEQILGPLYGKMESNGKIIYHKTVYDFCSLKSLLISVGFHDIYKYDWRMTDHSQFDDCSQAYLPHMNKETGVLISLNVECIK
jgi:predicted SAM-dependent methyltransferase